MPNKHRDLNSMKKKKYATWQVNLSNMKLINKSKVMSRYEYILELAMANTDQCLTELIELPIEELEELVGW